MYQIFNISWYVLFFLIINSSVVYGNHLHSQCSGINKLYINSTNLVISQTKNQACFTGEVILCFDDLMIKTTILDIFYKTVNGVKTISCIFIPSRLIARRNHGQDLLVASSAKYFVETRKLVLSGSVIVQSKDGIVKTNKLVYYTELNNLDFRSVEN